MWKCISRGLHKTDAICNNANFLLGIEKDDFYKDVGIFNEMINWRALLYSLEMLNIPNSEAIVSNILEESLYQHMKNLITSSSEKMQAILKLKPKGNLRKRSIENIFKF